MTLVDANYLVKIVFTEAISVSKCATFYHEVLCRTRLLASPPASVDETQPPLSEPLVGATFSGYRFVLSHLPGWCFQTSVVGMFGNN